MTDFKVRCYHQDSEENMIGAEVIIYDGEDKIDTITIVDKTKLDELTTKLDSLDSTYVDMGELVDILTNGSENHTINATLLNGFQSDAFLKKTDRNTYSFHPTSHTSQNGEYGIASKTEYGHIKIIDNVSSERYKDGEALSAHQGYELNNKLSDLQDIIFKSSLRILIGRYSDKKGEYGTRIQVPPSGDGIYARILCEHPNFDYESLKLFIDFNNVQYEFNTNQSEANRKLYLDNNGSVISGRLGVDQPSGSQFLVTAFVKHDGDIVYPATTIKRVEVL